MEVILKMEKHLSVIQRPKMGKNRQFGMADIYMTKKSDAFLIANQWDIIIVSLE